MHFVYRYGHGYVCGQTHRIETEATDIGNIITVTHAAEIKGNGNMVPPLLQGKRFQSARFDRNPFVKSSIGIGEIESAISVAENFGITGIKPKIQMGYVGKVQFAHR